jgi:rubrerythrin
MTRPTDMGTNRTGAATSPLKSLRSKRISRDAVPETGAGDGQLLEAERITWARDASPVGTVPPPGTLKGVVKTAVEIASGHQPTVFIDKLGERLAFERTGARLYEALLAKFEAASVHEGGPTRAELERIRDDERRHVLVVTDALRQLGADPTAMTPSADVIGVASLGWVQVLTDPRTTLTQCLDVMLVAELADNDGWTLLVEIAQSLGFTKLADDLRTALLEEEGHLNDVRAWVTSASLGQAGVTS